MYRILGFVLLLGVSESGWVISPPSSSATVSSSAQCTQTNPAQMEKEFVMLSQSVIDIDKKLKDVCKQFLNVTVREIFTERDYKYEVSLPDFSGNFDVRVKYRVMYINGHDPRAHPECDRTYVSITVLPEAVNPHAASWSFNLGTLVVAIPYRQKITEEAIVACGKNIDDTTIYVRRAS